MKLSIKSLIVAAIVAIPSIVVGQTNSGFLLSDPLIQFQGITKSKLTLLPQPVSSPSREMSVIKNDIAHSGTKTKFLGDKVQTDPAYYYNMPIVKPGKTSKILIAKLDPDSTYSFNMPVRKIEIAKP